MVSDDMPAHILDILVNNLEIDASQVYRMRGPLSLSRLMHLYNLDRPDLKDAPFMPAVPKPLVAASAEEDIFALIRRQNILLHHPFDSFQPVVDFLKKAARIPMCWPSKWFCTALAGTRRLWKPCWRRTRKASRWRCWWN